jgi:hypothetical protein
VRGMEAKCCSKTMRKVGPSASEGKRLPMYVLTDYILLIVFIFIVLHFLVVLIVFEYGFVESNISFLMPS